MFEDLVDGDDPRVRALVAAERRSAAAYLACCDSLLELWEATPDSQRVGRRPHVLAEAGVALGLHPISVEARLGVAFGLQTWPVVRRQLSAGRLGVPHVLAALEEAGALGDEPLAGRVLQQVLTPVGGTEWEGTPGELRRSLRRTAVRLDPEGAARRRQEQTVARAGVRLRPDTDGLALLIATGAAEQMLAADRLLDVMSDPDGPDDARTRGQRQVDALLGALAARAGSSVPLELQLEIPVTVTSTRPVGGGCLPEPVTIRSNLTDCLLAVLAGDGADSRDAVTADRPADAAGSTPERSSGTGAAGPHGPGLDRAAGIDAGADADADDAAGADVGADDAADADAGDCRRITGLGGHRPRHGVPELLRAGPVDAGLLPELLRDPLGLPPGLSHVQVRRVCVDPAGQVVASDRRATPLHDLLRATGIRGASGSTGAGDGSDPEGRPAAELLRRLLRDLPGPPPLTCAYRPTADQTRVVQSRDRTCTFPGCHRTATRTDLDHRAPHPEGPTSVTNLHPLCRRHHRLKHDGWTCTRHGDGTTTWTSPRGQRQRTYPP